MKGVIAYINETKGKVAVVTESGDFSIFELSGWAPATATFNDEVSWEGDEPLGSTRLVNESRQEPFEVVFQNHHVDQTQLRRQLQFP